VCFKVFQRKPKCSAGTIDKSLFDRAQTQIHQKMSRQSHKDTDKGLLD